jgi:hypothetical protein
MGNLDDDWQVKITKHLIEGGVMGRPQSELIRKAGGNIRDGEVIAFLRLLAADKKAQKFILPGQKAYWRATTEIEKLS